MNIKYESTVAKEKRLEELGFIVHTMWECQWQTQIKSNENISRYIKNHPTRRKEPMTA